MRALISLEADGFFVSPNNITFHLILLLIILVGGLVRITKIKHLSTQSVHLGDWHHELTHESSWSHTAENYCLLAWSADYFEAFGSFVRWKQLKAVI